MLLTLISSPLKNTLTQNFNHESAITVDQVNGINSCADKMFKAVIVNAENSIMIAKATAVINTIILISENKDKSFFINFPMMFV